jgi:hypothetical protein
MSPSGANWRRTGSTSAQDKTVDREAARRVLSAADVAMVACDSTLRISAPSRGPCPILGVSVHGRRRTGMAQLVGQLMRRHARGVHRKGGRLPQPSGGHPGEPHRASSVTRQSTGVRTWPVKLPTHLGVSISRRAPRPSRSDENTNAGCSAVSDGLRRKRRCRTTSSMKSGTLSWR